MKSAVGLLGAMALLPGLFSQMWAQRIPGYLYDESKIAPYTMLDPLRKTDGKPVVDAAMWNTQRRPEVLRLFEENEFGVTPIEAKAAVMHAKVLERDDHALNGLAVREQIELTFDPAPGIAPPTQAARSMRLLLYVPRVQHASPVVLGLNFLGNQSVIDDPGILPTPVWSKPKGSAVLLHEVPAANTRGAGAEQWQVEMLLKHGYGLATIYYGDIEPDFKDAAQYSMRQLFQKPGAELAPDSWGAFGAWAWGLSRAMDYLQNDPLVDASHVAVTGHSRLGKAADWAAAQDTRFAALLSTESGHGGQTIQRRALGETVEHLEHSFPYWFCPAYARWAGHDSEIPVDGNLLMSLMAPRLLYVASAAGDEWSDPKGEFLSAVSASSVYRLLGEKALPAETPMPAVDAAIGLDGNVAYHERAGKHDVTSFDWEHYIAFLNLHWGDPLHWPEVSAVGEAPPPATAHAVSGKQVKAWRQQLLHALYLPSHPMAPETDHIRSGEIAPGVTAEKVTYRTLYGLRVPAVIYRPTLPPTRKMPAIVLVNGHGGDKSSWYAYYAGVLYARAGAVVLTYDPIGEGERNDEHKTMTGEHDQLVFSPASMPVRLGGLMVADTMGAVSALAARSDVDRHRIGLLGFSMGSFIAALAGAADTRIHALLLDGGGDLDGVNGYWDSGHAIMCQAAPYKALRILGDRGAVLYTLNARRGDSFIINGTVDTVVAIPTHGPDFFSDLRARVVALNGSEKGVFSTYFDPGASHRPSWMTPTAAAWLNAELEFPAWQSRDVRTMPTVSIHNWAEQVGYEFGKSTGREDRDAGIVALKADVPLLTAQQLDVFSQPQWNEQKSGLVYASWLERAAAEVHAGNGQ
ncbi:alpha/beta fold hydrolase [Silvibacterium sp.]|uniref:alpha/beta hydrolase family protein n=1 Tax=Silvibacterium sp. TaxID=1964179 RepID=UPI0039E22326